MQNNFLQAFEYFVKSEDILFSLNYFDVVNDKVEINYNAYIANKLAIKDLFICAPIESVFSPATRNEDDFEERDLMRQQDIKIYLRSQSMKAQKELFKTLNFQSCKEQTSY